MIEVSIPSMEPKVDKSGKSKKLFRVEVLFNERKHFVLRRTSEFQALHRKLRKIIQTPDFPSKRTPHLRTKPLEQRMQELEDYIQEIIYQTEDVPQVLLDFLHVKHFHTGNRMSSMESLDELDSQDTSYQLPHQRVLGYFQDPYLSDCTTGGTEQTTSARRCVKELNLFRETVEYLACTQLELCLAELPDVVVDGVLHGFYPRDTRVSFTSPKLADPEPLPSLDV